MKTKDFLQKTFLFKELNNETLDEILSNHPPEVKDFKRGELVYSSTSNTALVGFVLSGELEVRLERTTGKTILNSLLPSDSFGVLSVYSTEEFPTKIFASRSSRVLFFSSDKIRHFVNNYSQISSNLIVFLAERISFLNKKVITFSGNSVEDRLAAYLLCESQKHLSVFFPFNCQKTADEINAGRASVYRAIASLTDEGLIEIVDKKIYIKDREGLERITK